jgi:hypothetical protein
MFYKAIEDFDVLREAILEFLEQLTKAELVGICSARGRIDVQVYAEHVMLWTVGDKLLKIPFCKHSFLLMKQPRLINRNQSVRVLPAV